MNRNAIYWATLLIVVAIASGGIYYQYQNTRPCVHPIPYDIGAVDSRFDITNAVLISDAESAAAIWNKAAGKTVLVYVPGAALKINLIYDAREANANLGSEIALQQSNDDTAHAALDALHAQLIVEQASYNQEVKTINARGGATKSEAMELAKERESLDSLANSVDTKVASYNASVDALNTLVRQYNQSAGQTFREGEYIQDSTGERINIFEFVGHTQLERVLAHEFGHAIGLGHNDDPNSIMYANNESGNLVPTKADLSALQTVCGL
jgi:hypothetical protein